MAEMAKSKESFFKELEDLDKVSHESSGGSSGILGKAFRTSEKSRNIASPPCRPPVTDNVNPRSLSRTPLAPQPKIQRADSRGEVVVVKETPYPKQNDHGAVKRPLPSGNVGGKRKKVAGSVKIIPEAQQIFKGLSFCRSRCPCVYGNVAEFPNHAVFIPNNDISPARRLRIQRCQEYGATWTQKWGLHVSHVIVEKDLVFQDVLGFLGQSRLSLRLHRLSNGPQSLTITVSRQGVPTHNSKRSRSSQ